MIAMIVYLALVLGVLVFHAAMILGAPWGHLTMGGRWPGRLPGAVRLLSLASSMVLAGSASIVAIRSGLLPGPAWAGGGVAFGAVMVLSVLAVVANAATPSPPERRLWLPVTLLMLAAVLVMALA